MLMPKRISTSETVLIVEEGYAIIEIDSSETLLKKGESVIIPSSVPHSLLVITSLKAIAIIPVESNIKLIHK